MQTLETITAFRAARADLTGSLGLVPTMGYLHEGHLELVRRARAECSHVAVSIFVNPTQFGPNEDLARYPRDLPRDLELLQAAGVELVFAPAVAEMYPADFGTYVEVQNVTAPLEGARRPGHFRGVATVVCKLFNIVGADRAYFGQKDAQQTVVIRQMVRDLNLPVEIVVVPTVREADGLAKSSRNVYLDPAQRAAAPVLWRALQHAAQLYEQGENDAEPLRRALHQVLAQESLAQVEYVSAADPHTLMEIEGPIRRGALLSLAVRFGATRLIDNVTLAARADSAA
ncbi:MAG: pantoate--beta-alanine ligase [Chloroflexota bacterium]|nr:pantoate--beta-alanine ligase [Chloroflexota bacterium]